MAITKSLFVLALRAHEAIYELSDGRLGHRLLDVPTLLLRTTGRRSGETRTNALAYARDGESYIVVPSNGGADHPPAWLLNLQADPEVEIQVGRERSPARAEVIEPGQAEFQRVWELADRNNKGRYSGYQEATERPIPVVALTAATAPPG